MLLAIYTAQEGTYDPNDTCKKHNIKRRKEHAYSCSNIGLDKLYIFIEYIH